MIEIKEGEINRPTVFPECATCPVASGQINKALSDLKGDMGTCIVSCSLHRSYFLHKRTIWMTIAAKRKDNPGSVLHNYDYACRNHEVTDTCPGRKRELAEK